MPNYCDNVLKIKGKQINVVKFLNDFVMKDKDDDILVFSMNKIMPTPERLLNKDVNVNDIDGESWYQWRLKNWGCKWDLDCHQSVEEAYDQIIEAEAEDYVEVEIPYTTPWGPNLEFLENASKKYTDIIFNIKYFEGGCELAGEYTYEAGDETENYVYNGSDSFEYYVWIVENDFEDSEYLLEEMGLEEDLVNRLRNYFNGEDNNEEDVIDLRETFLGNNLPDPK